MGAKHYLAIGLLNSLLTLNTGIAETSDASRSLDVISQRLEARLEALENENKTLKSRIRQIELANRKTVDASRMRAAHSDRAEPGSDANKPEPNRQLPPSGARPTAIPISEQSPGWGAFFVGFSAGPGGVASSLTHFERELFANSYIGPIGPSCCSSSPTSSASSSNRIGTSTGSRAWGALADMYLGYNFLLDGNFVLGIQAETTLSRINVPTKGFQSKLNYSCSPSPCAGFGSSHAVVESSWMASALGRVGYLVDQTDLVYALAGYTYGKFIYQDENFGLDGITFGAGWERVFSPSWSLKVEYRHTRFESRPVWTNFNVSGGSGGGPFISTSANITSNNISANLHSVRIGVSHYFDFRESR